MPVTIMKPLAGIFLVLALLVPRSFGGDNDKGNRFRPDRVILMPARSKGIDRMEQLHRAHGRRVLKSYNWLGGLQVVQLADGEKIDAVLADYRASGAVEFAEPDFKLHAQASPNDPEFKRGTQWSLFNSGQNGGKLGADIGAVAGWDTLTSASNIIVAVVDTGIRYTHEDLAANIWVNPGEIPDNGIDDDHNGVIDDVHGFNAINNSGDPMDDAGHGTHVSGIIGAVGNNGKGIAGIAWNVKLMACRFLSQAGDGDTSDAIACIDYARRMGAQVINASWGGPDFSASLFNAINQARQAGIIFVTAAGNDAQNIDQFPIYPACYNLDNIVVVGGSTRTDLIDTSYSNFGANNVDLFAPGTGIYSTWFTWDGAYTSNTGTSMATPHVAGVVALMRARFTTFTSAQIISRLLGTVDPIPDMAGKCRAGGRLSLAKALGANPAAGFTASSLSGEPPLTVVFTNLSFGEIASQRWSFGDESDDDTNRSPTHVFAYPGIFPVELEVIGTNGKTNSYTQEVRVVLNYAAASDPYSWIDPSAMTALPLTDNGVSSEQPLPFAFPFYGRQYNSIFISANGALSFSSDGLSTTSNTELPSSGSPNALICPYWDNLNPAAGGSVRVGVAGEAPDRKFVVSWVDVPRNSSGVTLTFQAILEERSANIVFQYAETRSNTSRGGAKRATVGLENSDGSAGVLYTYNGAPIVLQNETAVRFSERPYRYLSAHLAGELEFEGARGGAFSKTNEILRLQNFANRETRWRVQSTAEWLAFSADSGVLPAGAVTNVEISLSPRAFEYPASDLASSVAVLNEDDGSGNETFPASLKITEAGGFEVNLSGPNTFVGGLGGPFLPGLIQLSLAKRRTTPVQWLAAVSDEWLTVGESSGEVLPGQTNALEILLTGSAEQLGSGSYFAAVSVRADSVDGGRKTVSIPVFLQINARLQPHSASVSNGVFRGAFSAPRIGNYAIERSDDLVTWQVLDLTPSVSGETVSFEDAVEGTQRRFYRLVVTE